MKEFIEKNNDEQRLFGPSRIGWNEISRFRESKGWKIIRKKKVI